MDAKQFRLFVENMKATGNAASDADVARQLGLSHNSLVAMKKRGTMDRRTDLACTALLHRLEPFGSLTAS